MQEQIEEEPEEDEKDQEQEVEQEVEEEVKEKENTFIRKGSDLEPSGNLMPSKNSFLGGFL